MGYPAADAHGLANVITQRRNLIDTVMTSSVRGSGEAE